MRAYTFSVHVLSIKKRCKYIYIFTHLHPAQPVSVPMPPGETTSAIGGVTNDETKLRIVCMYQLPTVVRNNVNQSTRVLVPMPSAVTARLREILTSGNLHFASTSTGSVSPKRKGGFGENTRCNG